MAAWLCDWAPPEGDPPSPCNGDVHVVLTGPSNEDGVGSCARHLGDVTLRELNGRRFVVVAAPGEIPEQAVRGHWRKAS